MRWLINYIRSCFCKHDWELLDETEVYTDTDYWGRRIEPHRVGDKWTYICKKCKDSKVITNY